MRWDQLPPNVPPPSLLLSCVYTLSTHHVDDSIAAPFHINPLAVLNTHINRYHQPHRRQHTPALFKSPQPRRPPRLLWPESLLHQPHRRPPCQHSRNQDIRRISTLSFGSGARRGGADGAGQGGLRCRRLRAEHTGNEGSGGSATGRSGSHIPWVFLELPVASLMLINGYRDSESGLGSQIAGVR